MKIIVNTDRRDYEYETGNEKSWNALLAVARRYEARRTLQGAEAAYDIYSQLGLQVATKRAVRLVRELESERDDRVYNMSETASAMDD